MVHYPDWIVPRLNFLLSIFLVNRVWYNAIDMFYSAYGEVKYKIVKLPTKC